MQIDIQTRNFDLTHALRSYAERRPRFALTSADNHVKRIMVRLSDINGPRGGEDKRCHLQVVLAGLADVVIVNAMQSYNEQEQQNEDITLEQPRAHPDADVHAELLTLREEIRELKTLLLARGETANPAGTQQPLT